MERPKFEMVQTIMAGLQAIRREQRLAHEMGEEPDHTPSVDEINSHYASGRGQEIELFPQVHLGEDNESS